MMQQTEKYQFNLVESTDAFSPAPLNENMELVEMQFQAVEAAYGAGSGNARIACGSYSLMSDQAYTLKTPFQPMLVVLNDGSSDMAVLVRGSNKTNVSLSVSEWGDNSVTYEPTDSVLTHLIKTVHYVAIGAEQS